MRILHTVEFYPPSVGGAQEVVRQISERLARRGHEVTVATTKLASRGARLRNGVRIEEFEVSGSEVRGLAGDVDDYRRFVLEGAFDVVMNYAAQQWATDALFPILDRIPCVKILVPCGFSGLHQRAYRRYYARMPLVLNRYDHVVSPSATYRDTEFCRRAGVRAWSVIPNGAAEDEFDLPDPSFRPAHGIDDGSPLLLTVGTHTGLKGHDLCIDAFEAADIEAGVLVVIGNRLPAGGCFEACARRAAAVTRRTAGRKRILLLDPPRREVVAAFFAADLFVLASRIECSPLVLFEAMAAGTPFLAVDCGNAAEIVEWSGGGLLVDTTRARSGEAKGKWRSLARLMTRLLGDPDLAARLGRAGRDAWRTRFTWERIAGQYEELYESLAVGAGSPAAART
jgi:glycosyltransferase involved in cell wall biosynthesis